LASLLNSGSLYVPGLLMAIDEAKREKMLEVVSLLKHRMRELDELGKKIKLEGKLVSPNRTRQLLEEIKVPPLKLLKES